MAMSGIATRKYIRSLMDRPRDPMAPPLFRGGRCELLHIASQLTVKTARIAHNRHPPRAKNDMWWQAASLGYGHCVLPAAALYGPTGCGFRAASGTARVHTRPVRGGSRAEVRIRTSGFPGLL